MHLNNINYTEKIRQYFSGKLSEQERFELEKEALDNPFLQDAMDGFSAVPEGLSHFKNKLKRNNNGRVYLGIGLVVSIILTVTYFNSKPTSTVSVIENEIKNKPAHFIASKIDTSRSYKIEVIPAKIETLEVILDQDRIASKTLIDDFSNNTDYPEHIPTQQKNETIEIEVPELDPIEENISIVTSIKPDQKIYPFAYFYDLAVVDYRRYADRERPINKTTHVMGGTSAAYESNESKSEDEFEVVERIVKVTYMDYLEETMYYFSVDRYKNALKRFNIISTQYEDDINAFFYGALCYYNLGDFESALSQFDNLLTLGDHPFLEEANWYKAKTLLKLKRDIKAKTLLLDIIAENGFYAEDAIKLLDSLK